MGTMKEPPILGDKGEKLSGHEAEAYTLDASKRKEDAQDERDLLAAMTGANIEETRGRQNRGRAQQDEHDRRRKDKEEFDSALRAALQQLQERLERINEEIAELNRKLRELEEDAAELAWARIQLENGESLETVLSDKEILRKLEEYRNRTGSTLDLNDRESVREALRMEQEYRERKADEYRKRVRELEKEKAEIETTLSEMERSDVSADQALKRMQEGAARGAVPSLQQVWRDTKGVGQVKETAGDAYSKAERGIESQTTDGMFAQFAGASFAAKAGIGEGIETKVNAIKPQFGEAVEQSGQDTPAPIATDTPILKGPKLPSS